MLLKNGTVISGTECVRQDIRISGERIVQIGPGLKPLEGEEVMDVSGCLAAPGGIDAHTHFDMPCGSIMTSDDFKSGTRAAVAGGTTTVIDFSEPEHGASLQSGLDRWHEKADGRSFADYSFHMTLSRYDEGMEEEIRSMIRQGVTSFKAYTAYKGDLGVEDRDMYRLLALMKKHGVLLMIHCENGDILDVRREELAAAGPADISLHPLSRPNEVEHEAVSRMIDMARLLTAPVYIVHTSTRQALKEIEEAKEEGVRVYCETCPQYLFLTEEKYRLPGFEGAKYVCSPPLRSSKDQEALWKGIMQGIVDTVSTDHCSFNYKGQKDLGLEDFRLIPNGLPGVENRLELMYSLAESHGLTCSDIARITAENPAKIFGLYPRKGVIQPGSDADLVIIRPDSSHVIDSGTQRQYVDYNPYQGMVVSHKVQHVFLRGQKIIEDGAFTTDVPTGNYLLRNPLVR